MDKATRQDNILAHELVTNERIIEHPKLGKIRLSRPTPRMQFLIGEEYRKQFHKDVKDPEILSRAELENAYIRRGMWSPDLEERIASLMRQIGVLMHTLELLGYGNREEVITEYFSLRERLSGMFKDDVYVLDAIDRYFNLDVDASPADRKIIWEAAETSDVDEILEDADNLREQISLLIEMRGLRDELNSLQLKRATLFRDCLEFRADRAEQLAQIYYCCRKAEDDSPLWPSVQDIWDADPDTIEFLQTELYFFNNGITDDMRDVLGRHGFMERAVVTEDSSDDSQDRPKDSSGGELAENEQPTSLESPTSTS